MAEIAHRFSQKNLDLRIPVTHSKDELDCLAETLNEMLAQIESLVKEMKITNDNIAHDLRTLIARLRVCTEIALLCDRSSEEYKDSLAGALEECDRILSILNTLLDISEMEIGIMYTEKQEVPLDDLLQDTITLFKDIADYQNITLEYNADCHCSVLGDFKKLRQVFVNLLDNAVKYNHSGGKIFVSSFTKDDSAVVNIEDTGIGIPPEHLPHIFKRFYRADSARFLTGSGLGLALSKVIVELHGGAIEVQSREGEGSIFSVTIPKIS